MEYIQVTHSLTYSLTYLLTELNYHLDRFITHVKVVKQAITDIIEITVVTTVAVQ